MRNDNYVISILNWTIQFEIVDYKLHQHLKELNNFNDR